MRNSIAALAVVLFMAPGISQADAEVDAGVAALSRAWAEARYATPENAQDGAFERLTLRAQALVSQYPGAAEPLVWQAIIVSTHAGVVGGLGALSKAKDARALLERAAAIDPDVLNGSVYTSLGSLYYKVPGWPLGFGDDDRAEDYLRKALNLNPDGIDANYFYGDFLLEQDRFGEAVQYLQRALRAPARSGRELADTGRREEARQALQRASEKLAASRS